MNVLIGLLLLAGPAFAGQELLIEQTLPKVVAIQVKGVMEAPVPLSLQTSTRAVTITGSGAFISSDGFVLTCYHLFEVPMTGKKIIVRTAGGKRLTGVLVGSDPEHDLALVKVFSLKKNLPHFQLGLQPRRGQKVIAFGAPLGIEKTVTIGYVSNAEAKQRRDTHTFTMHTASINPGNSGGPLVNLAGELVGVNIATYLKDFFSTAEGMHLAVRMDDISKFVGEK